MTDFALTLLRWFRENGRDLPWRQTRDPYAIWLSEIILQQTRVEQGQPYWERFMYRWPTVETLAAATEDEVLREWQGLGYYSRARNLHAAARQITARGGFPTTFDGIRALKGVGDYTAAAIASIAFDLPVAVVDGNVYRVLARHFGIDTPINTTEGKKVFAAMAQELLPAAEASAYNQAIMDFGAMQCTPQSPHCDTCPLADTCTACREGLTATLPVKLRKLKVKERRLTYIYIRCKGMTAIHRRKAGDIWQGLWEPYIVEDGKWKMDDYLARHFQSSIFRSAAIDQRSLATNGTQEGRLLPTGHKNIQLLRRNVKHVLTHRVLYADFYLYETDERPPLPADYLWIQEADIDNYAVPRLIEILLSSLTSLTSLTSQTSLTSLTSQTSQTSLTSLTSKQ